MTIRKTLLIISLMAGLSACATKADPEPVIQKVAESAPVQVFAPAPAPTPEPVVQQAPIIDVPPVVVDPNAPAPGSVADFAYQSGGEPRVFFNYNSYDLTTEARQSLSRQADWLNKYRNASAVIEGNADERGTREYNLALAARRAERIKSFLVGQGIVPSRLTTVSYGKERPIDGRSTEAGWARNRNGLTSVKSGGIG